MKDKYEVAITEAEFRKGIEKYNENKELKLVYEYVVFIVDCY